MGLDPPLRLLRIAWHAGNAPCNQKVNLLTRKDIQEKLLIKNNIIRFKYSGKLYEYENKHTSNREPSSKKKITFSDFKRLEKLSQKKND